MHTTMVMLSLLQYFAFSSHLFYPLFVSGATSNCIPLLRLRGCLAQFFERDCSSLRYIFTISLHTYDNMADVHTASWVRMDNHRTDRHNVCKKSNAFLQECSVFLFLHFPSLAFYYILVFPLLVWLFGLSPFFIMVFGSIMLLKHYCHHF